MQQLGGNDGNDLAGSVPRAAQVKPNPGVVRCDNSLARSVKTMAPLILIRSGNPFPLRA